MADAFGVKLQAARERSTLSVFIGAAECYCLEPECSIRELTLSIKEHDGPTTPSPLYCPACGSRLAVHHVLTLEEQREAAERDVRILANARLYRRRTGEQAVPLGVLLDDSLPERP